MIHIPLFMHLPYEVTMIRSYLYDPLIFPLFYYEARLTTINDVLYHPNIPHSIISNESDSHYFYYSLRSCCHLCPSHVLWQMMILTYINIILINSSIHIPIHILSWMHKNGDWMVTLFTCDRHSYPHYSLLIRIIFERIMFIFPCRFPYWISIHSPVIIFFY